MRITQLKNELSDEEFKQIHNVEFFKNRFKIISNDRTILNTYNNKNQGKSVGLIPIDCLDENIDKFLQERTTDLFYVKCPEYTPYYPEYKWTIYFLSSDDAIMFKLTFGGEK